MKAVIMAGGKGTRLRPLTCDKPKPLMSLCGRPVLEYIIELLAKNEIYDAVITLHYLGNMIKNHFDESRFAGVQLDFCVEDKPLGTAGSVRYALSDNLSEVLVISGDAMCDFDLKKAIEYHRQNNADATLIVKQVSDPREYGLVSVTASGEINGFLEKPSFEDCTTDLANTGIYILSQKAVELIKPGENLDFANDIFPEMLRRGMRLFAFEDKGYWCDIGDLKSYLNCQEDMLFKKVVCDIHGYDGEKVYIGKNSKIAHSSRILPGTVIGDNVTIGENCKISGVILNGSTIADNVTLNRAIIGENATVLTGAGVYEYAVLGSGAFIEEFAQICSGVKIWNDKTVHSEAIIKDDIKYGYGDNLLIGDRGIIGQTNSEISPIVCAKIGSSVASIKEGATIGVAGDFNSASEALKQGVISGVLSSGADVYDFGQTAISQFKYSVLKSGADFGVYIHSGKVTEIHLTESDGLPLTRASERKVEGGINRQEYKKSQYDSFGRLYNLTGFTSLYEKELIGMAKRISGKIAVQIKCADNTVKALMSEVLKRAGIKKGDDVTLMISPDSDKLTAYSRYGDSLLHEQIVCLIALDMLKDKKDLYLPRSSPHIIDALAEIHGVKVYRYSTSSQNISDKTARENSLKTPCFNDALVLGIKLIEFLDKNSLSVKEVLELIPEFTVVDRFISVDNNPGRVIKSFNSFYKPQKDKYGARFTLHPVKSGKGILLSVEAQSSETANELCDFYENEIKRLR